MKNPLRRFVAGNVISPNGDFPLLSLIAKGYLDIISIVGWAYEPT